MTEQPPAPVRRAPRARKRAAPPPLTAVYADRAREAQQLAPVGSLKRKGAGVAAVVLDGALTVDTARRRLQTHRLPREIRTAALGVLADLERAEPPTGPAHPTKGVAR